MGAAQGISEWIPISSEGLTLLIGVNFIDGITATELIRLALYLHLGTFLAALVYFKDEVWRLIKSAFRYRRIKKAEQRLLNFYATGTLVSGAVGYGLLKTIESIESYLILTSQVMVIALGVLLLITGGVQIIRKYEGPREEGDLQLADGIIVGVAQGLSALPGISRSGFTISTLLLRGFKDTASLKVSFIMSLPIVLVGNIVLNTTNFAFTGELFLALLISFLIGLATIHILLRLAKRIEFGWFVVFFGILVLTSAFFLPL